MSRCPLRIARNDWRNQVWLSVGQEQNTVRSGWRRNIVLPAARTCCQSYLPKADGSEPITSVPLFRAKSVR
jgi:hypothetical protein